MATFRCVMFGHILYDDKLTWEELLQTEARVRPLVQTALEECGAQHIDFTSLADALLVECLFDNVDRENNHALCDAVIRCLGPGVLARFLFLDRQMDSSVFYFLGRGKWQEQALSIPGPKEALSGWVVRQERKPRPDRAEAVSQEASQDSTPQEGDLLKTMDSPATPSKNKKTAGTKILKKNTP